jgi:hypothetical protein
MPDANLPGGSWSESGKKVVMKVVKGKNRAVGLTGTGARGENEKGAESVQKGGGTQRYSGGKETAAPSGGIGRKRERGRVAAGVGEVDFATVECRDLGCRQAGAVDRRNEGLEDELGAEAKAGRRRRPVEGRGPDDIVLWDRALERERPGLVVGARLEGRAVKDDGLVAVGLGRARDPVLAAAAALAVPLPALAPAGLADEAPGRADELALARGVPKEDRLGDESPQAEDRRRPRGGGEGERELDGRAERQVVGRKFDDARARPGAGDGALRGKVERGAAATEVLLGVVGEGDELDLGPGGEPPASEERAAPWDGRAEDVAKPSV